MKQIKVKKTIIFAIIAINLLSLCSIYYTKLKVKYIEDYTACIESVYDCLTISKLLKPLNPILDENWYENSIKYDDDMKRYNDRIKDDEDRIKEYEHKINSIKNSFIDWGMIKDHFQRNIKRANHN